MRSSVTRIVTPLAAAMLLASVMAVAWAGESATSGGDKSAAGTSATSADKPAADVPVVDEMPKPVKTVPPVYPESARKRQQQGTVFVQAKVLKSGKVGTVKVIEGKGVAPDLDQAAVSAVKQWEFRPAMLKDKPVEAWVVVPIAFKLH